MRTKPPDPEGFRCQMVALVRTDRTPAELSRGFEPCGETIRHWVKQADFDEDRCYDGLTKEELRCLRRENHPLSSDTQSYKVGGRILFRPRFVILC